MRRQAPLDKCFSCAPFSVFPPQLIADIKRGVLENEKLIRLYFISPFLVCFITFFCVFFFSFNLCFVLFRFFFCLVWVLFVMFFFCCFACLVLFLFCFVLFNLFRFLVFCLFFFLKLFLPSPLSFYIDTMQIEIMYNPANSICYGTCETDREFEWLNEWKLLLKGTVWVWVYLQPTMNFTKVKISLWPIVAFPLISELNESDWRACRSDNQGRETNLNCKCYVPIHYSYLLPVLHVEGFWKLQARNRGVLFSFTGVKKHLIFGVILFEVVSFEKDDRQRLFLRDCWMDLFGFDVEEWWMSLCHEFSSR